MRVTKEELEAVRTAESVSGISFDGINRVGEPERLVADLVKKYSIPEGYGLNLSTGEFENRKGEAYEPKIPLMKIKGAWETREVYLDGKLLSPERSQGVYNHSPGGFNWGYSGSGPSQLALAIMLEKTGKDDHYHAFKFDFIATLPKSDFEIEIDFDSWLIKTKGGTR